MIRLAVLGTGGMANSHARNFGKIGGVKIVAACDIDRKKAVDYAQRHGIQHVFDDLDEMLASGLVDAVTNVTSDAHHAATSLKVIAAGKHILCEKPLATNYRDAQKMADAARRARVVNMVNFSYRDAPAIQKARALVASGRLGRVMHVQASYLQSWLVSKSWGDWRTKPAFLWRLSTRHGSKGVLGDIGVHILDFATYPTGAVKRVECRLKTFRKNGTGRVGEYVLDANDSAAITVELEGGALGVIHTTRWATGHANSLALAIHGDKGALRLDLDRSRDTVEVCLGKNIETFTWKTVKCPATPSIYRRFVKSIRTGVNDQPDFARGAAIQKVLDACAVSDRKGRPVSV